MGIHYNQLSIVERERIMLYRSHGFSVREIGLEIGRSHSTVSRELRRNEVSRGSGFYLAHDADWRARRRKRLSGKRFCLKSPSLRSAVVEKLRLKWSPELISGWLLLSGGLSVSHESIYRYTYYEARELIPFLVRSHKRRRSRVPGGKPKKSRIANRIGIEERPLEANDREQFGHWESDSVISRASKVALNVLVERKSRFLNLSKLTGKTSIDTRRAIVGRLSEYPESARRSITYDNGTENVDHGFVNAELGTRSYFCNPYRSWEKGTVENTAGLVRRTIPKGTDIGKYTDSEIEKIEWELNNRPRKCLGYRTPTEVFQQHIGALPP